MWPTYREHDLFADGPMLAGVWELHGDHEIHGHDFVEIAIVGRGTGRHLGAGGDRPLRAGDVAVLRPGAWHGFAGCRGLEVANLCLSAAALRTRLAFLYDEPILYELLWKGPVSAGRQGLSTTRIPRADASHAVALIEEIEAEPDVNHALRLGRMLTVLGTLVRSTPPAATPSPHPSVAATIERMEAAPAHPWSVTDLARAAAVHPAHLSRLFRQHVGLPPLAYLARTRVELAADLLARTTAPVGEVGARVGWPDPTYFARRFHALVGLTPTDYRRRARSRRPDVP